MSNKTSRLTESVMGQIKNGNIRMKPRVYFVLLGIVSVSAVIFAGIAASYLASIIFFWVRVQTADGMAWGARANLQESITSFPWLTLALAALLLFIAVTLVRRHGRMYRHKSSTIALIIVTLAMVFGLGLTYFDIGKSHTPNFLNGQNMRQGPGPHRNH